MKRYLLAKGFRRTGLTFLALFVASLAVLPALFPGKIEEQVKSLASKILGMEVSYTSSRLSFFKHFPNLTVSFEQFSIVNSDSLSRDTLFFAAEASAGINLISLIKDEVEISGIYIVGGLLVIDKISNLEGESSKIENQPDTSQGDVKVAISKIRVSNTDIVYKDIASDSEFSLRGVDYKGSGSLSGESFNLKSRLIKGRLSARVGVDVYLRERSVKAKLSTEIGIGEQFSLRVNRGMVEVDDVPLFLNGDFSTMAEGFIADMSLETGEVKLRQLFALLPDSMLEWRDGLKIEGRGSVGGFIKGEWNDSLGLRPDLRAELSVLRGYLKHKEASTPLEDIEIKASISTINGNSSGAEINLDTLNFKIDGRINSGKIKLKMGEIPLITGGFKGGVDLNLLTKAIGSDFYRFGGDLVYDASFSGLYDHKNKRLPTALVMLRWSGGSVSAGEYPLKVENLNADIVASVPDGSYSTASFVIDPFNFIFDDKPFNLKASLSNFNDLVYDVKSNGDLDIESLLDMLSIKSFPVTGKISADLSLLGAQADVRDGKVEKLDNKGTLLLRNFRYTSSSFKNQLIVPSADVRFDGEKAWLEGASFKTGNTTIKVDGYASNYMGYYFEGGELNGKVDFKSDKIIVSDLLPNIEPLKDDTVKAYNYGTVQLPDRINLIVNIDAKEVDYDSIPVKNVAGRIYLTKNGLSLKGGKMEIAGARFLTDIDYSAPSLERALFSVNAKADSFSIKRVYREIPLFRELFSSASAMEGLISLNYSLSGALDGEMSPVLTTLKGKGEIVLDDVKVQGLMVLSAISREMGRDSIDNPQLRSVVIKSSISDNIIKIERTRLRVFGFRPRFEGEASLDGRLNIRFRLGLPPFGIIGIPATITGTMDKPKVNLRRSREGDSILTDTEEPDNN